MLWEHVKNDVVLDPDGSLIFDDTVIDKRYAKKIALARRHYFGNAGGVINGIAVVTCVYVNPKLDRYGLMDYRIYDKAGDGKSKLDHVRDMLSVLVYARDVVFSTVLMDAWYASKPLLLYIENLDKTYYVPLKRNRLIDDSDAQKPYQRIDALQWTAAEESSGKRVKLHRFPRDHKVKVFRVASSQRTDYVATNERFSLEHAPSLISGTLKGVGNRNSLLPIGKFPPIGHLTGITVGGCRYIQNAVGSRQSVPVCLPQ